MDRPRRRLALLLEYDGTSFCGSQLQANGPSIQGELERAIESMTGCFTRVALAGRTDAGVHALGQVACFDTDTSYPCQAFVGGLNVRLAQSIAVRAARKVEAAFDPRRQATARRYRYHVLLSGVRSPLLQGRSWRVPAGLDVARMQEASQCLLGEHDFAAFASPEAARGSTRRTVRSFSIRRCGRSLFVEAEANAFLMHQMRRTVAALVDIGSGRLSLDEFRRHLDQARPGSYEHSAPACGLCLLCVRYDPPLFPDEREQG
jgi:tRNA pseudouridine38-40 synthase